LGLFIHEPCFEASDVYVTPQTSESKKKIIIPIDRLDNKFRSLHGNRIFKSTIPLGSAIADDYAFSAKLSWLKPGGVSAQTPRGGEINPETQRGEAATESSADF